MKSRGLTGHGSADVFMNAAGVQFTPAFNIAGRAQAEAKIRFVRPIDLIVATAFAWLRMVGDLIVLKASRLQAVERVQIHSQLGVFVQGMNLAHLSLLPQASSLFVSQAIRG